MTDDTRSSETPRPDGSPEDPSPNPGAAPAPDERDGESGDSAAKPREEDDGATPEPVDDTPAAPPREYSDEDYRRAAPIVEAMLFASDEPLTLARIRDVLDEFAGMDFRRCFDDLNGAYRETARSFEIRSVAGGYQIFTLPEYSEVLERLFARRSQTRLSQKALEALAIVAYKQPVTRTEIEEIRGVNSDGIMRTLLSRNLIAISGQASTPGTPFLYKTTRQFLEYFGLNSLKDLPKLRELDEIVESATDLKERFGEAFLKDIAPELLGIQENGSPDDDSEEIPDDDSEDTDADE